MIRIALALVFLGLPAWAAPAAASDAPTAKQKQASAPKVRGKAQAPVTINAVLGDGTATVTVRFDGAATDATVGLHGVDGLVVTSDATPIAGANFARGESITIDVMFTKAPGQGHLAVSVGGEFSGSRRNAVNSFVVGKPTADQLKPAGTPAADAQGNAIKVMPSQAK